MTVYDKVIVKPINKVGIAFSTDNYVVFEEKTNENGELVHTLCGYAGINFDLALKIAYKHVLYKRLTKKAKKAGNDLAEVRKLIEKTNKDFEKLVVK